MKLSVRCIQCFTFSWLTSWRCLDKHNFSSLLYLISISVPDLWSMSGYARPFSPSAWNGCFTSCHPSPPFPTKLSFWCFLFLSLPRCSLSFCHPWFFFPKVYVFLTQSATSFAQCSTFQKSCHLCVILPRCNNFYEGPCFSYMNTKLYVLYILMQTTRNLNATSYCLPNYFLLWITRCIQHWFHT